MPSSFVLMLASAILLVLPFHCGSLGFLAFFALIPYFTLLKNKEAGEAFKISYWTGLLFFALMGYWLNWVNVLGFALLVLYLALYFGLFGYWASKFIHSSSLRTVFYIPAFWVALEFVRGFLFSGLPWGLLGYSQWKSIVWIQISDLTGAWGVSYFVLLINVLLFKIIDVWRLKVLRGRLIGILFIALVVVASYGEYQLMSWKNYFNGPSKKAAFKVSVLQGNIPQEQKWDAKIKGIIFEKYKRLTLMAALQKPDLIVWPETSFPGFLEDEPTLAASLRSVVRQAQTPVLVGAPVFGDLEKGLKFYNSGVYYSAQGEEKGRYSKIHLVPFGEYVPFEPLIGFIRHFVTIGHFSAGSEKTVFELKPRDASLGYSARFSTLICYEDIFPGLVRGFCLNGANLLVNITNDAWFGKTTAPYQHAQGSIFRAVENRVPVVRSTNTGLSCFISQTGEILSSVKDSGEEIMVTGHATETLMLRKITTFYTRFGEVFMVLIGFLCFLAYRDRAAQNDYSKI